MSEIIYQYSGDMPSKNDRSADIRWLGEEDYAVFAHHLELCGQRIISEEVWREVYADGTVYCCLFEGGEPVARACIEVISPEQWEIADVRTAREYRNRGFAYQICRFVLEHIISEGKTPSIRTEEDNFAMQKVINRLGFIPK